MTRKMEIIIKKVRRNAGKKFLKDQTYVKTIRKS